MTVDYYALLTKAVAGKDTLGRDKIYKDAYDLITRSSHLTREAAASNVAALEAAIRRIEDEVAIEEGRDAAQINEVLSEGANWKPWAFGAGALALAIALAAFMYGYVATKGPANIATSVTAPPPPKAARTREDVVMADLKAGEDGGSTGEGLPFSLQRQVVFYRTTVVPGSIVIDRENRFLYLIDSNNSARRYGIGIAQECLKGGSFFHVTNKLEWPDWRSSAQNARDADALAASAGRPGSPLGARALLLDKPGLLIHGTNSPKTIGHLVASGCIRLVNDDVEDLYRRVSLETRVVFVS
ncbi:L,D-transpeptidase [Bradyrhizobium sp. AUGA SZCCT0160]|uniref:L,D-transpeptidase n=1 Tax=Bradyrhizobium sp. AUGA SZCCT0160 TaxID=2807662 RepID=UPI001BA79716|nr:L,D-transpeptidase [Bradyrhizobium sp. AUGA SZCCT0160]MBR1193943.1 L,D-transpeptidase [Bradyrhizobium sp. AUGA SZCCT0160]